jgi:hypothetical protein
MFPTENDMSTRLPPKRHTSHMAQTNYLEHDAPNLPKYSDAYALASATQHLRLPALDSANISELQTVLDPQYTGFQHQEHRNQMLYDPRTVPHPALVPADDTLNTKYEPSSWEMPFVHQPQPLKSYASLTARINPQIYVSTHPAASYITPPEEEHPLVKLCSFRVKASLTQNSQSLYHHLLLKNANLPTQRQSLAWHEPHTLERTATLQASAETSKRKNKMT